MKNKMIPALLSLTLLTACGTDTNSAPAQSTAAQTTASSAAQIAADTTSAAETTASTAASTVSTTASETTTAALAQITSASAASTAAAGSTTAAKSSSREAVMDIKDSLTYKMAERLNKMENEPVRLYLAEEMEGMSVKMDIQRLGKKSYIDTDMFGFHSIILTDGTSTYTLDPEDKTYAKADAKDSEKDFDQVTDMLDDAKAGKIVANGKETFKGKSCTYEEFEVADADTGLNTVRYYFDEQGNLIGLGMPTGSEALKDVALDFSIKFDEKIDESIFNLPKDYKEIDQSEMGVKLMQKMFGGNLGSLLDGVAQS